MRNLIYLICLIIVFSLISCQQDIDDSLFSEDDFKTLIVPNNQLAFKLLEYAEPNEADNTFISPTSLLMALAMVYNGAEGETKKEIASALQIGDIDKETLNRANGSLIAKLMKQSKEIELSIANSIWLNDRFHFNEQFLTDNSQYFNAEISEINVSDSNSVNMINDWVSKATNEKITKIIEEPLNQDLVAILINALYFKGNWTYEFDESLTVDKQFTNSSGKSYTVPLMKLNEKLPYIENDVFQAVSLPYGEGNLSMDVYLSKENITLAELKSEMTDGRWEDWNRHFIEKKGTILLPKFELEYETTLNDTLEKLGMKTAFTKDADFPNMITSDNLVWISKVRQKTYIDVHEKGTEAAAVTSVEVETTSVGFDDEPFYMEVNRPFFLIIKDVDTNLILFTGMIDNPSL